jgi:hypothetical protein
LKNNLQEMKGGARIIPKFQGLINDPGITNDEKKAKTVFFKDKEQQQQIKERMIKPEEPPKPIVEMKVMDTILGKQDSKPAGAQIYPSTTVPMPNPFTSPVVPLGALSASSPS